MMKMKMVRNKTAAAVAAVCALFMLGSCAAQDIINNLPGENATELYDSKAVEETPEPAPNSNVDAPAETAPTDTAPDSAAGSAPDMAADSSLADSSSLAEERVVAVSAPPNSFSAEFFLEGETDAVRESYRKLFEGIFNYKGVIELPEKSVTADQVEDLIYFVRETGSVLDIPSSRYEVLVDSEQYVTKVNLSYKHSFKEGAAMYDALMQKVDEIVKESEPLLTEYDKIKYFHDTIVNGCVYDETAPDANTAYGVLCGGRGVCDGYAKAFQLLCEKANISAIPVSGKLVSDPNGEGHMWNKVRCDEQWYNIDVTWDDPVGDSQVLRYDYFLVDDSVIARVFTTTENRFMTPPAADAQNGDYYTRNGLVIGYDSDVNSKFESMFTSQMHDAWSDITVDVRCENKGIYDSIFTTYFAEQADGSKGFGTFLQEYMAPGEALRYTVSNSDEMYTYHVNISKG